MGTGEANFLGGVAKARGVASPDIPALKAAFFDSYISICTAPGAPSIEAPGARALVAACRAAGLKTAVATAADRIKAEANLQAAGFDPAGDFASAFDALVTADAFERLKPAPDAFLAAAAAVGVPPARCVVIEDAPAGIAAARAAGMRVVGVTSTLSPADMAAQRPDAVVASPAEIEVEVLKGLELAEGVVLC
jgi:beta-phosphoglucomutase-like phosphatase (HAD superfamily)